jgi:hypothetical protein
VTVLEPQALSAEPAETETPQEAQSATQPEQTSAAYERRPEVWPPAAEIAVEAYALYVAGGYQDGHDLEHWLEAERLLRSRPPG